MILKRGQKDCLTSRQVSKASMKNRSTIKQTDAGQYRAFMELWSIADADKRRPGSFCIASRQGVLQASDPDPRPIPREGGETDFALVHTEQGKATCLHFQCGSWTH